MAPFEPGHEAPPAVWRNERAGDGPTPGRAAGRSSITKVRTRWYRVRISLSQLPGLENLASVNQTRYSSGFGELAPEAGFEPTTRRLTAGCSTAELLGTEPRHDALSPTILATMRGVRQDQLVCGSTHFWVKEERGGTAERRSGEAPRPTGTMVVQAYTVAGGGGGASAYHGAPQPPRGAGRQPAADVEHHRGDGGADGWRCDLPRVWVVDDQAA